MTLLHHGGSGSALLDQITAETLVRRALLFKPPPPVAKLQPPKIEFRKDRGSYERSNGRFVARLRSKVRSKEQSIFYASFRSQEAAHAAYIAASEWYNKERRKIPEAVRDSICNNARVLWERVIPAPSSCPEIGRTGRLTVADIQRVVSWRGGCSVTRGDMIGPWRNAEIVRARQISFYLCRCMTPSSYPEIGRRFGNRDHTTVLYAFRKISALIKTDKALATEIEALKGLLKL
jgi:hypothetical protein